MKKSLLWIGGCIAAGFAIGWSGLPMLGATIVTLALFLSPVVILSATQRTTTDATI